MKKLITLLGVACLLFTNLSCKETKEVITKTSNVFLNGNYIVSSINNTTIDATNLTLSFNEAENIISGNAGCNQFSGNYSLEALTLNIGLLRATEAYCDEPIMKNERAYFKALKNTGSYKLNDGILTLYSKTDRAAILTAKKSN